MSKLSKCILNLYLAESNSYIEVFDEEQNLVGKIKKNISNLIFKYISSRENMKSTDNLLILNLPFEKILCKMLVNYVGMICGEPIGLFYDTDIVVNDNCKNIYKIYSSNFLYVLQFLQCKFDLVNKYINGDCKTGKHFDPYIALYYNEYYSPLDKLYFDNIIRYISGLKRSEQFILSKASIKLYLNDTKIKYSAGGKKYKLLENKYKFIKNIYKTFASYEDFISQDNKIDLFKFFISSLPKNLMDKLFYKYIVEISGIEPPDMVFDDLPEYQKFFSIRKKQFIKISDEINFTLEITEYVKGGGIYRIQISDDDINDIDIDNILYNFVLYFSTSNGEKGRLSRNWMVRTVIKPDYTANGFEIISYKLKKKNIILYDYEEYIQLIIKEIKKYDKEWILKKSISIINACFNICLKKIRKNYAHADYDDLLTSMPELKHILDKKNIWIKNVTDEITYVVFLETIIKNIFVNK